ncbi:MAG: hypothetical protein JXQ73_24270 [Phycisphaerae bacterium]|nr:hypothetical protein [Phycisphaerae bacterium]
MTDGLAVLSLLVLQSCPLMAAAPEPRSIGADPQLFVDDVMIAAKQGVVRTIHPCRKLPKPVLEPEHPWEGNRVYVYGSVLYDPTAKQFRMWYMSNPIKGKRDPRVNRSRGCLLLYATSTDGLRWQKPDLGLYEFDGSKHNNIIYGMDSPSIILDKREPDPAKRYKMVGYVAIKGKGNGAAACYSADGLHWQDYPGQPLFKCSDTITCAQKPQTGEYLAFHKINAPVRGHTRRLVALAVSKDMATWSSLGLVLTPDEKDDAWAKGPDQRTEFYDMSVFPYGGQFLGLVAVFRKTQRLAKAAPQQSRDDGPIHAELTHSRDGRTWRRLDQRVPIIPNGPSDFDAGCILGMINTPVIVGDEMWVYYTAITTTHGGALPAKRITIGRAAWRRDGFVSLDADDQGGVIETVLLSPPGVRLFVNADASGGALKVEALDESGKTLAGYSSSECAEISGDSIRHAVRWKDHDQLKEGSPLRLRFHLKNAKLYSYSLTP